MGGADVYLIPPKKNTFKNLGSEVHRCFLLESWVSNITKTFFAGPGRLYKNQTRPLWHLKRKIMDSKEVGKSTSNLLTMEWFPGYPFFHRKKNELSTQKCSDSHLGTKTTCSHFVFFYNLALCDGLMLINGHKKIGIENNKTCWPWEGGSWVKHVKPLGPKEKSGVFNMELKEF